MLFTTYSYSLAFLGGLRDFFAGIISLVGGVLNFLSSAARAGFCGLSDFFNGPVGMINLWLTNLLVSLVSLLPDCPDWLKLPLMIHNLKLDYPLAGWLLSESIDLVLVILALVLGVKIWQLLPFT